jgi:hypothetical protein
MRPHNRHNPFGIDSSSGRQRHRRNLPGKIAKRSSMKIKEGADAKNSSPSCGDL